ncbi:MAG: substrate-binding domain-containing protein [Rhodoferax sp.]
MTANRTDTPPSHCQLHRAAAWFVALILASGGACADTLRLGGSSSALGSMEVLAAAYRQLHPEVAFVFISDLSSGGGVKALAAEKLDLALSSRPLSASEQSHGLLVSEYGRTPWVFATTPDTPVKNLSLDELAEIYAGRTTVWPDGKPIRLVLFPESDADSEWLRTLSPAMDAAMSRMRRDGMIVAETDRRVADALERTAHALGNSTLALLLSERRRLKALALNGVAPSPASIADGSYPYYKTFYAVRRQSGTEAAREFVDFVLSRAGAAILRANGHWVVDHAVK